MSFIQASSRKRRWISLTPLIDVVFILLMFFMLTTQFTRIGVMNISVAQSTVSNSNSAASDAVLITVFPNGEWQLNDAVLSTLVESDLNRFSSVDSLTVVADKSARLQDVVLLLDALVEAGVNNAVWLAQNDDGGG